MTQVAWIPTGMDRETQAHLRSACQSLHHELVSAGTGRPSALVAGLPPGDRSIPVEAAEHLAALSGAVPLLLLCNEPLVRDHVMLDHGRMHLIAPPHDSERLQCYLEHAIAGKPISGAVRGSYQVSDSRMLERWAPDYWACAISGATSNAPEDVSKLLLVEKRPDGCFVVLPTESARRQPDALIELYERLLLGDDRSMCQWLADLSGKGALLAYDSETHDLIADLPPNDECAAFLLSPHRLPNISQLPNGRSVCIPAAPGDILLAAVGGFALQALDPDHLRGIVRAGGVLAARELQQRFHEMPAGNAVLLLEARA